MIIIEQMDENITHVRYGWSNDVGRMAIEDGFMWLVLYTFNVKCISMEFRKFLTCSPRE